MSISSARTDKNLIFEVTLFSQEKDSQGQGEGGQYNIVKVTFTSTTRVEFILKK